jgi:uncharacterized protein (TIGR01777 family)
MKIAVAGASGFVGRALVRRLEAEGHEVRRMVRRPAERPDEITWHPTSGEVEQRDRLEGIEAVVNLAGASLAAGRWTAARQDEIRRSRVEGTRTLVATMTRLNHRPRVLVCASAVGYYGDRGEEELTEASSRGEGFLAEVCAAWEGEARIAAAVGIRTVVLRMGVVLGPGGGVLARLRPVFRAGLGGRLGDGRQWMSWISLEDLVEVARQALHDERWSGPVNAVAPGVARNAEFTAALARAWRRPAIVRVPGFLLRAVLGPMADEALLASARVQPQRLQGLGFGFKHPQLADALRAASL